MRKRTDQEILRLVLQYEVERIEQTEGEGTRSLFDVVVETGLVGDEQPEHVLLYGSVWGWDFKDASVTEEEFCEELLEPVEALVRKRNANRSKRLFRITDQLWEKRKKEE
jgi:hypothetical protein|tara:strand:- start:1491 stop:1820 length:330 start_codon:yes stop_codon:yes gene_type:complete